LLTIMSTIAASPPSPSSVSADNDAVARLIESERAWSAQLDAARNEADRIVAAARADSQRAEADLEAALPRLIAERRKAFEADTERAVSETIEGLRQALARYAAASDALVGSMAEQTAARAPWFVRVDGETSHV
jgi:vacuolar-type H+-ATPase subunit H